MIIAFSVSVSGTGPLGAGAAATSAQDAEAGGVSRAVAEAIKVVRASGLPHRTSSMFTEIEGEWDEVMAVIKHAVDAVAPYGARISLVMKADIRTSEAGEKAADGTATSEAPVGSAFSEIEGKLQRVNRLIDDQLIDDV